MTCAEFKELAAAYAIGALAPDERAACDAHLGDAAAAHEGCFEALAAAHEVADRLAASLAPARPAASTWAAIEAATARAPGESGAAPARRSRAPWLAAAAALIACGALGWSRWQSGVRLAALGRDLDAARAQAAAQLDNETTARKRCLSELQAARSELKLRAEAVAMLALPTAQVLALAPQKGAPPSLRATAMVDLPSKRALIVVNGLDHAPDRDFELWVIKGKEKRAAGLLRADLPGQPLITEIDPAQLTGGADAFAVTLEPRGGGPSPRGPVMLVGALPKT